MSGQAGPGILQGHHQLADVTSLLHGAECIDHMLGTETTVRQWEQRAIMEQLHDFLEQTSCQGWSAGQQLVGINTEVADIALEGAQTNRRVLEEVAFAQLQETAKWTQYVQTAAHGFACQRVQHYVHTFAASSIHHVLGKAQAARIKYMVGTQQGSEHAFLVRASSGINLCAQMAGQLNCCNSDAACGTVDQYFFTRLDMSQMRQRVVHGEEHSGNGGGSLKIPTFRHGSDSIRTCHHVAGKAGGTKAHHRLAYSHIGDISPNAGDDARELQAQTGPGKTVFYSFVW